MRFWLQLISFGTLLTACSDGDIIDIQLDFDKELNLCEIQTAVHCDSSDGNAKSALAT